MFVSNGRKVSLHCRLKENQCPRPTKMNNKILHVLDYFYYTYVVGVAIVGNSLVIMSILKFHNLRCNANYLIGALAGSDLLMAWTWPIILGKFILYRISLRYFVTSKVILY